MVRTYNAGLESQTVPDFFPSAKQLRDAKHQTRLAEQQKAEDERQAAIRNQQLAAERAEANRVRCVPIVREFVKRACEIELQPVLIDRDKKLSGFVVGNCALVLRCIRGSYWVHAVSNYGGSQGQTYGPAWSGRTEKYSLDRAPILGTIDPEDLRQRLLAFLQH